MKPRWGFESFGSFTQGSPLARSTLGWLTQSLWDYSPAPLPLCPFAPLRSTLNPQRSATELLFPRLAFHLNENQFKRFVAHNSSAQPSLCRRKPRMNANEREFIEQCSSLALPFKSLKMRTAELNPADKSIARLEGRVTRVPNVGLGKRKRL